MRPYVRDISLYINEEIDKGRNVLFEGAQGTLLDVDHGTYPYVTSSNTTAGAACTGSGVWTDPHRRSNRRYQSLYHARGQRTFPTEMLGDEGDHLCGSWAMNSVQLRDVHDAAAGLMDPSCERNPHQRPDEHRPDPLGYGADTLDHLKVCVAYECEGQTLQQFPSDPRV